MGDMGFTIYHPDPEFTGVVRVGKHDVDVVGGKAVVRPMHLWTSLIRDRGWSVRRKSRG